MTANLSPVLPTTATAKPTSPRQNSHQKIPMSRWIRCLLVIGVIFLAFSVVASVVALVELFQEYKMLKRINHSAQNSPAADVWTAQSHNLPVVAAHGVTAMTPRPNRQTRPSPPRPAFPADQQSAQNCNLVWDETSQMWGCVRQTKTVAGNRDIDYVEQARPLVSETITDE